MQSRSIHQSTESPSIPNLPEGQYTILRYNTVFDNKSEAMEVITLKEGNSKWEVIGYYIH
ncbi:DUF4019 domain-containing protein [Photobacterium sanctipauli]|uniref:DUF4019 domain-containing protein n=1 Tax=Photobacterium sanctipauli TaxID=1342794 RepID=A0A2T3P120_9GAMM|nr:DUF4019 domain-containing protein [Photobacterium sanctipauli]